MAPVADLLQGLGKVKAKVFKVLEVLPKLARFLVKFRVKFLAKSLRDLWEILF